MKNYIKKLIAIILLIPIFLDICIPSSYAAATKVFGDKVNVISKDELETDNFFGTIDFQVKETGVYCVEMMPNFEKYEWKYGVSPADTDRLLKIALNRKNDSLDANANIVENYEFYSENSPCAVLIAGKTYTLHISKKSGLFKLDDNYGANENFVAVKLTKMASGESIYYELGNSFITAEAAEKNFRWPCSVSESNGSMSGSQMAGVSQSAYTLSTTVSDNEIQADYVHVVTGTDETTGNTQILKASSTVGETTNIFESILTSFLVKVIGDNVMKLIGIAAGEEVTIDRILFNQFSKTRLAFFSEDYNSGETANPFLRDSGILPYKDDDETEHSGILNTYFRFFTMIAIIAYIVILLYMGIRIVLSSTGKDMARYKKLFADWVTGVALLFLFPYVMKYSIKINNGIVNYIGGLKTQVTSVIGIEEAHVPAHQGGLASPYQALGEDANAGDYMSVMRKNALDTGRIVYAICWLIMIKEVITFLFIYIKRMLITLFLIVIFPLVMIYYAIDKIGDGKSQAFSHWTKEFILNVFLQTFHAINYVVVMGVVFAIAKEKSTTNFILVIIGITYVANGDKILRGIFSHMKGGGGGTVKDVASGILKTTGALHVLKSSANTIKGSVATLGNFNKQRKKASDALYAYKQKKFDDNQNAYALNSGELMGGSQGGGQQTPPAQGGDESLTNQNTEVQVLMKTVTNQNVSEKALKEALDKLSGLKGENPEEYDNAFKSLNKKDKKELDNLMKENDAINAVIANIEGNVEVNALINASMNVIINNKTASSRNMGKLNNIYSKAVSDENEQKILGELKTKNFSTNVSGSYNKLAGAVVTRYDAINNANLTALNSASQEIISANNAIPVAQAELEGANAEVEEKTEKLRETNQKIAAANSSTDSDELEEEDAYLNAYEAKSRAARRRDMAQEGVADASRRYSDASSALNEARGRFTQGLEVAGQAGGVTDIEAATKAYLSRAATARTRGDMSGTITNEEKEKYTEIAKARAIHDKSSSGEVSAIDLWKAERVLKKAKKEAGSDAGIAEILKADENNPHAGDEFIGSDEFEAFVGTKVLEEAAKMEVVTREMQDTVDEIISVIKQEASEGELSELSKEIFRKAGVDTAKLNEGEIPILKDTTPKDEIQKQEAQEKKEIDKAMHAKEKHEKTTGELRAELFEETLKLGKESLKLGTAPATLAVGLFSAGAYMGAASDYSITKALGAEQLGSSSAKKVRDAVLNTTTNVIDETANRAVGLVDTIKNGSRDDGNVVHRTVDVLLHGDENESSARTLHDLANSAKKKLTPEEQYLIKKKAAEAAGARKAQSRISQVRDGIQNNNNHNGNNNA